jgi:predicted peroxiredoxin
MADKVVVNLATGLEDAERVTVAFLVAGAAVEQGKPVAMFLTKEAVRIGGGATPLWEWIGERATVFSY